MGTQVDELPLRVRTPDSWAKTPLSDIRALLSDHAYLERKAASNALELLNRWPAPHHPETWTTTLAGIARDEASHLNAVIRHIRQRGWKLERLHRSRYASDLRSLVRMGKGPHEIADRLLVSALIEARSCERFEILGRVCEERELREFYRSLHVSELGHFTVFHELAGHVLPEEEIESRWNWMLAKEAAIVEALPVGPGLHSGFIK